MAQPFTEQKMELTNMKTKTLMIAVFSFALAVFLAEEVNAQKRTPQKRTEVAPKGNMEIEAGLVYTNGDVKPIARAEFFLISKSAAVILGSKADLRDVMVSVKFAEFAPENMQEVSKKIKDYLVSSTVTSFQGKASISSIAPGNYYIFGYAKIGRTVVVWNVPVTLKEGSNSIVLDNHNAACIE